MYDAGDGRLGGTDVYVGAGDEGGDSGGGAGNCREGGASEGVKLRNVDRDLSL